jgi:hypothetical protein
MTTIANLPARKQQLLERLQESNFGEYERAEIERLLAQIDSAFDLLDEADRAKTKSSNGRTQTTADTMIISSNSIIG